MNRNHNYRAVAEFEKQESVILSWPPAKYVCGNYNIEEPVIEVIRNLMDQVQVIVNYYYQDLMEIKSALVLAGIDIDQLRFEKYQSDDVIVEEDPDLFIETSWLRDYGAEIVMDDEGNRGVVDFDDAYYGIAGSTVYERGAAAVKGIARWHASLENIDDILFTRLVSEGGDREFNGSGVMMTVEETEVTKRNPAYTRNEVEAEFKSIFNLDQVIWLPRASYDDEDYTSGPIPGPTGKYDAYRSSSANGHIDEMCRFVSKDTVILAEVTEEEAKESELHRLNKERFDQAYEVLKQARDQDGNPFKIIRIPVPEAVYVDIDLQEPSPMQDIWMELDELLDGKMLDGSDLPVGKSRFLPALSYCNFLITNGSVLAQKYYQEGMPEIIKKKDEKALEVLKAVFPDREVVQINTLALNIFGGGIHCLTRQVPSSK